MLTECDVASYHLFDFVRRVAPAASPGGAILIADQVNEGEKQEEQFLTVDEHRTALKDAGFVSVWIVYEEGDLALFGGSCKSPGFH